MRCFLVVVVIALVFSICESRATDSHESVVSVYTTQPSTTEKCCTNIYKEIATNIAESVINPIYRFFDFSGPREKPTPAVQKETIETTTKAKTETSTEANIETTSTKATETNESSSKGETTTATSTKNTSSPTPTPISWKPWKIELSNEADIKSVRNDLNPDRDVEEVSAEKWSRRDKKPEKFLLFPTGDLDYDTKDRNDTINEIGDDDFLISFDEVQDKRKDGPKDNAVVYFLEMVGSVFQLAWGAFLAIFKPKP